MGWLENNMYFSKRKLEKDHLLAKFGWNFKFYTSGHPVTNRPNLFEYEVHSIRDTGETWRGVNFPNLSLHDLRDRKVGTNPLFQMVNN